MATTSAFPDTVTGTDGTNLRVHDLGGSGHPVLAAHATGFNGTTWRPLATHLARCRTAALDFRGHGGSPLDIDAPLSWQDFADDVLCVLDALEWSDPRTTDARPVGIGHSMGGAALVLAELARPGTFAGLWLFEPIIFPPSVRAMMRGADNPLATGALRRRRSFATRADAIDTYASKPPMNAFDPDALAAYVEAGFIDGPDGTVQLTCAPENESRIYGAAATCDAFERLGSIQCPVDVVRGALEAFGPSAIAGPAAAALPHGQLVAHDELSHFGPMENPAGLAAEITQFISSLA